VYGLGVIVYQMLSGQQPYSADTPMGVVVKHITEPVPEILKILPTLPHEVDAIIKTAMAKDKNQRYPNTIELAKALNMVAFGHEGDITYSSNTGLGNKIPGTSTTQFGRGKTGLIIVGIVLLVAVIGFFLLRNQLLVPDQPTLTVTSPAPTEVPTLVTFTAEPTVEVQHLHWMSRPPLHLPVQKGLPSQLQMRRVTDYFCQQRAPYASVIISSGATPEVKNPETNSECIFSGTRDDGRQVFSCTGPNFQLIELEVCATACHCQ
jgi:serine/threonine protein kinase